MIPPRTDLLTLLQTSGYGYIDLLAEVKLVSANRRRCAVAVRVKRVDL